MRTIILLLFCHIPIFILGQVSTSEKASFKRYVDELDEFISLPMTALYLLRDTGYDQPFGLPLPSELTTKPETKLLIIEMNPHHVLDDERYKYASGAFQLMVQFPKGNEEVNFRNFPANRFSLVNNYSRPHKGKASDKVTGSLRMIPFSEDSILIDGVINIVKGKRAETEQEIVFKNFKMRIKSLEEYRTEEKEKKRLVAERERQRSLIFEATYKAKTKFYQSVFSKEQFPNNRLIANYKGQDHFVLTLSNSYILNQDWLSNQSAVGQRELMEDDIFLLDSKANYLLNVYHLDEEGQEIRILIGLNKLAEGDRILIHKKSKPAAKYNTLWRDPLKPIIYEEESKYSEGEVLISSVEENVVSGVIHLRFKIPNRKRFEIHGEFELPIIGTEKLEELSNQIKAHKRLQEVEK